jgi:hypothetical protein
VTTRGDAEGSTFGCEFFTVGFGIKEEGEGSGDATKRHRSEVDRKKRELTYNVVTRAMRTNMAKTVLLRIPALSDKKSSVRLSSNIHLARSLTVIRY